MKVHEPLFIHFTKNHLSISKSTLFYIYKISKKNYELVILTILVVHN